VKILYNILCVVFLSCASKNEVGKNDPIYRAAVVDRFVDDQNLIEEVLGFNRKIIAAKYVQKLMVGRVAVNITEIDSFYNEHKTEFKRKDDEVLVLVFKKLNKNTAIKIKTTLDRNALDSEKTSEMISKNKPERAVFKRRSLKEGLSKRLFGVKKGNSLIIQQDDGFTVFYILEKFNKGTLKDLVFVSDEIQVKLLAIKNHQLKEKIVDSLGVEYAKP
jgi:hypothetical protein